MREWTDTEYAQAALDMLPGGVEEIAAFLRTHKIKGERTRAFDCPIANWVRKWTGNPKSATCSDKTWANENNSSLLKNPPAVRAFIYAFDSGEISL